MIDLPTLDALMELAQRAPKTKAELLWLELLIERLNARLTVDRAMAEGQGAEEAQYANT